MYGIMNSRRSTLLFMLALTSWLTLMPLAVHWRLIGSTVLVGVPMVWAAEFTFVVTIVLIVGNVVVITRLNKCGRISDRIRKGSESILGHSFLTILAATVFNAGGTILLVTSRPRSLVLSGTRTDRRIVPV